ncbi:Telomere-associated protein RIF1 [Nymphon striatum]|nr:Telomere-associated protein RIF1 [Nymphon striatum]
MLKSNIVNVCNEEGLSYSRFLELYKKLISYTIQGNATSTLSFCQSVIQLLTDAVSSISRAESLLQLWVILVEILCGQINKSQEVNQGDSMSHDFTCIYHTLLFPAKFLFTKMFESSSSKLMHSTWNKLYKTFTYCASLVVNLSDNIWCEELCAKLLSLISDQSDFSLDTFYLINNLTKVIVSITDDIQMSAVNDVDTDNIKSKTSAKKNYLKPLKASKVLRNIKSLVGLISKVIFNEAESVKCLESTFQNKVSRVSRRVLDVIMAANEAVWCELIKVLSKLFRNIHNSDVLFKLLEELSFPISVLLAQPVKEKVDGLWSDVTQALQLHYSGLYDDKMLELCTPLLKVTLCHTSSVIKKNTRLFWHSTFGQSASLNYPDDLKVVMEKVHPPLISDIQEVSEDSMMSSPLLSFKDVNDLRIPPQINPDRNKFGQNGSFLEKSPLKSPVKTAKSPSKTSLTALASKNSQKSPARRSILNTSIDDMDTQDFVPIKTPPSTRKRILTKHQKEVLKNERFVPPMYNDLSQDNSELSSQFFSSDTQDADSQDMTSKTCLSNDLEKSINSTTCEKIKNPIRSVDPSECSSHSLKESENNLNNNSCVNVHTDEINSEKNPGAINSNTKVDDEMKPKSTMKSSEMDRSNIQSLSSQSLGTIDKTTPKCHHSKDGAVKYPTSAVGVMIYPLKSDNGLIKKQVFRVPLHCVQDWKLKTKSAVSIARFALNEGLNEEASTPEIVEETPSEQIGQCDEFVPSSQNTEVAELVEPSSLSSNIHKVQTTLVPTNDDKIMPDTPTKRKVGRPRKDSSKLPTTPVKSKIFDTIEKASVSKINSSSESIISDVNSKNLMSIRSHSHRTRTMSVPSRILNDVKNYSRKSLESSNPQLNSENVLIDSESMDITASSSDKTPVKHELSDSKAQVLSIKSRVDRRKTKTPVKFNGNKLFRDKKVNATEIKHNVKLKEISDDSESYNKTKNESESHVQATDSTDSSVTSSKSLIGARGRPKQKSDDGTLQQSDHIETQTQPVNTKFKTANENLDAGTKLCADKPSNDSSLIDSEISLSENRKANDSRSDQSNNESESYKTESESDMQATNSTDSSAASGKSLKRKRGRPKQKRDHGTLQQSDRIETQTQPPVNTKFKTANENFDSGSKLCVDKPSNDSSLINSEISQSKNRKVNDSQSDQSNNDGESYKTESESESYIQATSSTDSSVTTSESLKKKRGRPKQKSDDRKLQQSDRIETQTQPVNTKFKTANENLDSGSKLCVDKPSNDSRSDQSNNDGESYKTESESDMQATNSTDSSAASSKSLKRKRGRPKQTQPVNTKFKTANENFDSGSKLCVDKPSNDSRSDQSNNDGESYKTKSESDMQATNSTDSSVTSGESLRKKRGRPKQKCDDGKLQQSDRNETQTQPVNKKFKTPNENFDSDSKLCVDKPSNDPSSINNEISQSKNRKANDSQSDLSNNNSENYKTENESESLMQAPNSTDSSVTSSESLRKKRGRPKQKCDDGKLQQSDCNETQTQPVNKKFKTPNENFDSGSKLCVDKPSNDSSSINSEISQSENRKANDSQSDQSNKNNSAKLNRRRSCRIDKKNNVDEKLPSGSEAPVESSFNFKHSSNDMDATQDSALDVDVLPKSSTSSELITDMNVVSISSSPTHDNRTDNSCTTDLVQISDSDSPKISSCSSQSDESIKLESESIAIEYLNSPTVISEPESDIHLPPSVAQSSKSDQKFHESSKLKATENFKQTDAPNLSEIGKEEIVKENQTLQLGSSQQDNSDLHSAVVESVSSLVSDVTREAREDSPQTPNTNHGVCHQRTILSVESIPLLDDDVKQETNKDAVGSQTSNTCVLPISKDNCISETVTSAKNLASYVTIGNSEGDVILSEKHKHMKESNELKPVTNISKDGDNNITSRLIEDSKIVVEVVGENRKDVKLLNLEKMVETADLENISSEKNVREGTEDDKINENELQDSLEKSISDDSLSKGKIGCSNQTICYNSDMISPMSRAHKILQASLASNVSSELSNVQKKEKKFTSPVTQPQKKYFPSPSASPSPSILKKRIVEDSFKKSYSSPKSKRHVSFADPPVLTEAEISLTNHDYLGRKPKKRPVNRCLQPVNDLLEEDLTSSFEMESCDTQQLNSEESIECNSAQPFFPKLITCEHPVVRIISSLTSSIWVHGLEQQLVSLNVTTIGEFCKLSEMEVKSLPIKEPKLSTARNCLSKYSVNSFNEKFEEQQEESSEMRSMEEAFSQMEQEAGV